MSKRGKITHRLPVSNRAWRKLFAAVLALVLVATGTTAASSGWLGDVLPGAANQLTTQSISTQILDAPPVTLEELPAYEGEPSVTVNDNEPYFSAEDLASDSFKGFTPLDYLGRCGTVSMLVGPETLPHEKRGSIGMIKPSGWKSVRYDWVDGESLYNRCHLLGYLLSGENANELNLITGTRTLNKDGMLPYEELIADYVQDTGNHVLYRVTPLFEGNDLVARGVLMEARSIEDGGDDIRFCVWCYNMEPGVIIDYATGENQADPHWNR